MRNSLLVALFPVLALTTASAIGCGDASPSAGIQRSHGAVAGAPNDPSEDPNAPAEPSQPPNPNADTPAPAPATPGTTAAQLGVTLSTATPATDLGTSLDITVTVEPKAGFTGSAALTATGLPAGVTATFVPASVTLNTTPVTSKLTLLVPYTATPSAAGGESAIVVKAAAGAVEATANANFKVNPKLTMTIPVNAGALLAAGGGAKNVDGWAGAIFGAAPSPLTTKAGNPIAVIVKNADSAPHIVHGNAGFVHGDTANPVPAGGIDPKTRTLAAGVNTSGYIHGETNGTSVGFAIKVNTAP